MDQTQLQQKIAEYFAKLPKEAQDVFSSLSWVQTLNSIATKYNLNGEQIELLGTETTLVLLGIIQIDEYKNIVKEKLNLSGEIIIQIIAEIDETILKTIKTQLTQVYESNNRSLPDSNFSNLQNNVQEAIANSNWKEKLYDLANKYKLAIPQMGILEETTAKVMKNEIHPDKYEDELASKLTISKDDLSNLVKDINNNILITIRELLKSGSNNTEEEIPLPPYRVITNDKLPINNMEEIKPIEIPKQPETVINNITMDSTPVNMLEEKLKGATISDHNVSDYSTPKINVLSTPSENKEAPLPRSFDPYREAF